MKVFHKYTYTFQKSGRSQQASFGEFFVSEIDGTKAVSEEASRQGHNPFTPKSTRYFVFESMEEYEAYRISKAKETALNKLTPAERALLQIETESQALVKTELLKEKK